MQSKHTHNSVVERILYLAITEREKSLKFYIQAQNLPNFRNLDAKNVKNSAKFSPKFTKAKSPSKVTQNNDNAIRTVFTRIADKEQEVLAGAKAILRKISEASGDNEGIDLPHNEKERETDALLLPSALPSDILGELLEEMGELDSKSLAILALGVESHHLKSCDFLIKATQNLSGQDLQIQNTQNLRDLQAQDFSNPPPAQNPQKSANAQNLALVLDTLYQLQALSYNHHIALLQGENPQEHLTLPSQKNTQETQNPPSKNLHNTSNAQNHTNPQNLQDSLLLAFLQLLQGGQSSNASGQNPQNGNIVGNLDSQNLSQNLAQTLIQSFSQNLNAQNLPASLSELARQSPLLAQISTSITQIQNFYAETKGIVGKLEKGELSQNELVAFLERLRF